MTARATLTQSDFFPLDVWRVPEWAEDKAIRKWMIGQAGIIHRCYIDGIPQLAPICAALRLRPDEARARFGKGLWRRVHHSELRHNVQRAKCMLVTTLGLPVLMGVPVWALREVPNLCVRYSNNSVRLASGIAKNRPEMRIATGLVHDILRMEGAVASGWSMRRLKEEHDRLARVWAGKTASTTPFAEPWSEEIDGYRFTRLISDADFAAEGIAMRHCIASYARHAARGAEVAFRIEGPERASVSFRHNGHVELRGFMNVPVSKACAEAAGKIEVDFQSRGME